MKHVYKVCVEFFIQALTLIGVYHILFYGIFMLSAFLTGHESLFPSNLLVEESLLGVYELSFFTLTIFVTMRIESSLTKWRRNRIKE